uniref:Uncharacterized protein n=1 Tax=Glossina austeni TaxID=7395 RepID=A0A1A9V4H4_GLOAU
MNNETLKWHTKGLSSAKNNALQIALLACTALMCSPVSNNYLFVNCRRSNKLFGIICTARIKMIMKDVQKTFGENLFLEGVHMTNSVECSVRMSSQVTYKLNITLHSGYISFDFDLRVHILVFGLRGSEEIQETSMTCFLENNESFTGIVKRSCLHYRPCIRSRFASKTVMNFLTQYLKCNASASASVSNKIFPNTISSITDP